MHLTRIDSKDHTFFEEVWDLYEQSFPVFERRLWDNHIQALEEKSYHSTIAVKDNKLIGLIFYWEWKDSIYIEHFAINPKLRGQNYGTNILTNFVNESSKTVILEIDPPIDEISKRRLSFYQNIGFKMNDYDYSHIPYRKNVKPHTLKILSYDKHLSQKDYDTFYNNVETKAMKYVER